MTRRSLTIALRSCGFLALTVASASAQDTTFVRALRQSATPFSILNDTLAGPAADILRRVAGENQFILIGEDHGIRELPMLVGAMFVAARPAGYRHLAVEIGPLTGEMLDTMMRAPNAQQRVDAFLGSYTSFSLPFFFWKEEAAMLERVVTSVPGTRDVVWGIDQEFIMAPTYSFQRLASLAPTKAARDLALNLAGASARADKAMLETKNPSAVWMLSSSDAEVDSLRSAFAAVRSGEARRIVDELVVSRDIYRRIMGGSNYESNQQRADLMKQHFLSAYRAAEARGEQMPKVMVKLGANHVFRGPSSTNTYELGSFIPEFAAATGGRSFGILVVVAAGTSNAYRPFGSVEADKTKTYDPLANSEYSVFDLKSVLAAASKWLMTYIDLRPARARSQNAKSLRLDEKGRRLVNSFDAVIVIPEGHASVYFR